MPHFLWLRLDGFDFLSVRAQESWLYVDNFLCNFFFLQKNPVNYIFVENVTEEILATGNRVHMPVLSFTWSSQLTFQCFLLLLGTFFPEHLCETFTLGNSSIKKLIWCYSTWTSLWNPPHNCFCLWKLGCELSQWRNPDRCSSGVIWKKNWPGKFTQTFCFSLHEEEGDS